MYCRIISCIILLLGLILAGCGSTQAGHYQCTVPALTPISVPQLPTVTSTPTPSTTPVFPDALITAESACAGEAVPSTAITFTWTGRRAHHRLTADETFTCNGIPFAGAGSGFSDILPYVSSYTCTYHSSAVQETVTFAPLVFPKILSQQNGDTIRRSTDFTLSYTPDNGSYAEILLSADSAPYSLKQVDQKSADDGKFVAIDTTNLGTGKGILGVKRAVTYAPTMSGLGNVNVFVSSETDLTVTWS